jgi:oligopeptide/dipeptide ABC transporter ATP-binding protein
VTTTVEPVEATTGAPDVIDLRDGEVVLTVEDLRTEFGPARSPIEAVRRVSFELRRGRTLVVLGESGSGKSVTARSILGLYGSSARVDGHVRLGSRELIGASSRDLLAVRGRRVGLVPQDPTGALDPLRRIGSQLGEVLRLHGIASTKSVVQARVLELLRLVGMPDPDRVARAFPHQLSGGLRQRAVIAIAVSCSPEILIADEPTTALDVTVQAQILELFRDLQASMHMAILLVTHDVGVAEEVGDEIAVMYAGRIVERGPAAEVLSAPAHPYTKALLVSLPKPGIERGRLDPIPGRAVLAGEPLEGCPFAPRCRHAVSACLTAEPVLEEVTGRPERVAACSRLAELTLDGHRSEGTPT